MDLTQDLPQFNMFSSSPIFTRSRMLPPTKINGSYMEKVVVGDGAIIMGIVWKNVSSATAQELAEEVLSKTPI